MWNTVSIVYFGDQLVASLQQPLRAVISALRQHGVERIMLLPRWKFGPHLDLVADCTAEQFETLVLPLCQQQFGDWMASHPSTTTLDPLDYETLSQRLALVELESGPYLPLLPNNSVLRGDYQPARALKLPQIAKAKETFLCDTLDLSLDLLAARQGDRDGEQFLLLLMAMMASMGQRYRQGGLSRGYLSYRSHAEYFFTLYDNAAGAVRQQFDRLDSKLAQQADAVVRAVCAATPEQLPLSVELQSLLQRWERVLDETARSNEAIVAEHYVALLASDTLDRLASEASDHIPARIVTASRERGAGPVMQAMTQAEGQRVLQSPEFMAYRTTVNFFYYLLPLLGISPMKKFCLCHLTANAVERVLGTSWQQILGIGQANGAEHAVNH
ncbi:lantibiotic dehydratase C-terminal domain-containing protein [Chitinimonas sp.]|uniref:lantibiotic dehydratase C-terminal domain-containing protein n=1 Tax=Chitinimonas sp. TaxID=1934313 RepID=UPI0035AE41E2